VPISNYQYRSVGVNMSMTPRVTYEGEIVLDLTVESSSLGASINVGGQEAPTFGSRKVKTRLRLREGESNLLAGLLRDDQRKILTGFPGLMRTPVLRSLFGQTTDEVNQTDIVMLLTPHIVRTHELTAEDLAPIYIGTQQNVGLSGPPPLIAPLPLPAPEAGGSPAGQIPQTSGVPGAPRAGVPGPPIAAPFGTQTTTRPVPPGTSPSPSPVTPTVPQPATVAPAAPAPPPAGVAPVPDLTTPETAPGAPAPVPPRDPTQPPPATPPAATTPPSPSAAQIMVTAPRPEFTIAGGPYTVPVSINNASRVSIVTLSITFNPNVLRVRTVQEGTFMRQGNITATFTPRIDAAAGRVDIAVTRTADQTGASGSGLLAALMFDAVGPGSSPIQFNAATVTVR
jgi:general secretion pathway protein D